MGAYQKDGGEEQGIGDNLKGLPLAKSDFKKEQKLLTSK